MKIGMLLNAPYPSDVRVKKETTALLKAGYIIYLLCLRKSKEKTEDEVDGVKITRINAGKNNYGLAFWDVLMSVRFEHPKFKSAIPYWVSKNGIQLIHVHDLPLVGTALSLRKELKIPVIADFHENYPEALKTWFDWKRNSIAKLKNKIFMNPKTWVSHERKATLECDHLIAVVEEMKQRLIHDYKASPEKITVVTNSEGDDFLQQPDEPSIYEAFEGKFIVTYSGNIGPHRGVDTVIEAMQYLRNEEINFVIVGGGSVSIMNYLKDLVKQYAVTDQVHLLGRQPSQKFYSFMKYAGANIIPHKSNGHTNNTVPHKLFQAMMVGRPVIVSTSAPLKRIILKTKAGIIFEADNARDLADKILSLHKDKQIQYDLGQNGIKATVKGDMNWEHDQKKLISLYHQVLSNLL